MKSHLIENQNTDQAQMSLIVELAASLPKTLNRILNSPRFILNRYRTQERINRIQEFDSACMVDYAKRVGITTIEKAGKKGSNFILCSRWYNEDCDSSEQ